MYLIDVNSKGGCFNEYWCCYDLFCYLCNINFDYIGYYEILEDDVLYVLYKMVVD